MAEISDFAARYGPVALVTGSARGIGAGFARVLGDRGIDLILTDIDAEGLERTAEQLRVRTSRDVRTIALDMRSTDSLGQLDDFTGADDVGLVICNHLFPGGQWQVLDTELNQLHDQLDANVRAYVDLAHTFGRRLRERGRGGLILMSSLTALVGSPYVTTYGASKAFILAFGSGLGFELRSSGVDVLTLVPSSVNTETYRRSAKTASRIFPAMEVEEFVEQGLAQLGKRWVAVPGARNVLTASLLTRLLPRQLATSTMGRNMESMLRVR
jgi:short-subunit dehydrogenase